MGVCVFNFLGTTSFLNKSVFFGGMVEGKHKSRTFRRIYRRLPSRRTVLRYEKRKPSYHTCGKCGKVLHGMLRERPYNIKKYPVTARRPERPFGGNLCSACSRREIIRRARK